MPISKNTRKSSKSLRKAAARPTPSGKSQKPKPSGTTSDPKAWILQKLIVSIQQDNSDELLGLFALAVSEKIDFFRLEIKAPRRGMVYSISPITYALDLRSSNCVAELLRCAIRVEDYMAFNEIAFLMSEPLKRPEFASVAPVARIMAKSIIGLTSDIMCIQTWEITSHLLGGIAREVEAEKHAAFESREIASVIGGSIRSARGQGSNSL